MVSILYLLFISSKMTIWSLVGCIGLDALLFTFLVIYLKRDKSKLVSYLQNFCGALFIFSGIVKAIDPLGTAYKMEQYFAEFESTFSETALSFVAPMFPWLSGYATGFSIFMIVLELVIGVMLLLGVRNKLTSWLFLLIVGFFTVLTGFTYLTGYVPSGVNFFDFGGWEAYKKTNMKVTDCGCFGDFLKLEPKVSFLKDVFLLIPAFIFLFRSKKMHTLWTKIPRSILVALTLVGSLVFCIRNVSWDLPVKDFRPFQEGVDMVAQKRIEQKSAEKANKLTSYVLTNKSSGEVVNMSMTDFLKQYKDYPKEEWEYDQVTPDPEIPTTKISEFALQNADGVEITDDLLSFKDYVFMVVAYKLKHESDYETYTYQDSIFVTDTIPEGDGFKVEKRLQSVETKETNREVFIWDEHYQAPYINKVNPVLEAADKAGFKSFAATAFADSAMIEDFRHATQTAYPFYTADDILLKTIIRSNPGVVLMKEGKIIAKWHHRKLPSFEEIKAQYMK